MASIITADTGAVSGTAGLKQSADSSGVLALATGTGTTAVTIDASQNVGIGTSSPARKLDVSSNDAQTDLIVSRTSNGLGTILRWDNTGGYSYLYNNGAYPLLFGTNSTERMRIDSSGNLLVGTTNSAGSAGQGVKLLPSGVVRSVTTSTETDSYNYFNTTAGAYRFYVTSGGTIFATSTTISAISDERLKENIQDINTGLDAVMALKPRRFDWKEGKGQDKKNAAGFIAQEFEEVFPDSVGTSKAGDDGIEYKNICHEELIPTLVKAIQEQQALITTLTERISALEAK